MEMKTIITVVIAGMLGALVFGVMLPVFAETTSADTTFTNDGYYNLSLIDENTDITMSWDHTIPKTIVCNGSEIDLSKIPVGLAVSIVGSDSVVIRYINNNNGSSSIFFNGRGVGQVILNSTSTEDMTFSITNDTLNGTFGTQERNVAISSGYYANSSGDYVLKKTDSVAYVKDDTIILAGLTSVSPTVSFGAFGIGTIDDMTVTPVLSNQPYTIDNVNVNAVDNSKYIDLYNLSTITFDIVGEDSSVTPATYSYFAVPYEVTAEKVNHVDGPTKAIMDLLPILIGIGLIIGIAGVVLARRF